MNGTRRIFISYSSADSEFARQLADSIKRFGGDASLSFEGAGQQYWLEALRIKLSESDTVVMVMPPSAAKSSNTTFFEAGAARALGKNVLVVVPDRSKIDRGNIPFDIANSVFMDATQEPIDVVAQKILKAA